MIRIEDAIRHYQKKSEQEIVDIDIPALGARTDMIAYQQREIAMSKLAVVALQEKLQRAQDRLPKPYSEKGPMTTLEKAAWFVESLIDQNFEDTLHERQHKNANEGWILNNLKLRREWLEAIRRAVADAIDRERGRKC